VHAPIVRNISYIFRFQVLPDFMATSFPVLPELKFGVLKQPLRSLGISQQNLRTCLPITGLFCSCAKYPGIFKPQHLVVLTLLKNHTQSVSHSIGIT
jgi:hypothetical protein